MATGAFVMVRRLDVYKTVIELEVEDGQNWQNTKLGMMLLDWKGRNQTSIADGCRPDNCPTVMVRVDMSHLAVMNLLATRFNYEFGGAVSKSGLSLCLYGPTCTYTTLGLYIVFMAVFHWSEYTAIAIASPDSLSIDSFLLNHSREYWIALCGGCVEFVLEAAFLPNLVPKCSYVIRLFAMLAILCGEALRKAAIIQSGFAFTHIVMQHKRQGHRLVTHGVYRLCRHPSYAGWFLFSLGTQILLVNPVCLIGYSVVVWRFFSDRIRHEEILLLNFFGESYMRYQRSVPRTGLPFIKGYSDDLC